MKQRVMFLFLIVHVVVVGFVVLPRLHAQEHAVAEGVWHYAVPGGASGTAFTDAPDDDASMGSCLWPRADTEGEPGAAEDDSGPLIVGHAFCLRLTPEGAARRGGGLSYRT